MILVRATGAARAPLHEYETVLAMWNSLYPGEVWDIKMVRARGLSETG